MDTNKNSYTFIFASVMVVVVALLLSCVSLGLKDLQNTNVAQEKKQNILKTIGLELSRPEADAQYNNYVKEAVVLNVKGDKIEGDAFEVNLATETKKNADEQGYPLFVAEKDGKTFYIIPLRGAGLWDAIWGYICLEDDFNTVAGVVFDHKGETPGLGADIVADSFQKQFVGKKIMDGTNFASIIVKKGGAKTMPAAQQIHGVDAISGGTLTSDGVTNMLKERLEHYLPYFAKNRG